MAFEFVCAFCDPRDQAQGPTHQSKCPTTQLRASPGSGLYKTMLRFSQGQTPRQRRPSGNETLPHRFLYGKTEGLPSGLRPSGYTTMLDCLKIKINGPSCSLPTHLLDQHCCLLHISPERLKRRKAKMKDSCWSALLWTKMLVGWETLDGRRAMSAPGALTFHTAAPEMLSVTTQTSHCWLCGLLQVRPNRSCPNTFRDLPVVIRYLAPLRTYTKPIFVCLLKQELLPFLGRTLGRLF